MNNTRIVLVVGTESIGLGAEPPLEDRNRMTGLLEELRKELFEGTDVVNIDVSLGTGLSTIDVSDTDTLAEAALRVTCWSIYNNVWKNGNWAQAQTL